MNIQQIYQERNISSHIYKNRSYNKHLVALRNIYTSDTSKRLKRKLSRKNKSGSSRHLRNTKEARKFKKSVAKKKIHKENERINFKLGEIKNRPATTELGLRNPDHHKLRRKALNDLVLRKKRQYDKLNQKNQKISKRLTSQKGEISIQRLQHDYLKNRKYMTMMTRIKHDKKKRTKLNDYLVYKDGRYRQPGESYIKAPDPRSSIMRLSATSKGRRRSRASSRRSSRATSKRSSRRNSARLSSRSRIRSRNGSRLGSTNKKRRGSSSRKKITGDFFRAKKSEDRKSSTVGFHKIANQSKNRFRVKGKKL